MERGQLFWHYPHYGNQGGTPAAAVRSGKLKLIRFFEDEHVELYDLHEDAAEAHDLSAVRPEDTERLRAMLDKWLHEVRALIPQPNPSTHGPTG